MAHRWTSLVILMGLLLLVGVGCQPTSMVELPAPQFGGPQIAYRPPAVVPPPVKPGDKGPAAVPAGVPREWIPQAAARPWKYIVIHHSATPTGGAVAFDRMHRDKGWDELGYHFVVGNGTDTRVGQIEVGSRWPKQKWGAHAKTPNNEYNDYGIGICLVGNFDNTRPSADQMKAVAKLVAYLMKTYHISPENIKGHGDTKPTDCPGKNMSVATVKRMAADILAAGPDQSNAKVASAKQAPAK